MLKIAVETTLDHVGRQHKEFATAQSLMEQKDEEDVYAPSRTRILKWVDSGLRVQKLIQEFDDVRR
jgi:hypothetical protein